jgi:hypothetical protein
MNTNNEIKVETSSTSETDNNKTTINPIEETQKQATAIYKRLYENYSKILPYKINVLSKKQLQKILIGLIEHDVKKYATFIDKQALDVFNILNVVVESKYAMIFWTYLLHHKEIEEELNKNKKKENKTDGLSTTKTEENKS